jgi:hypothetical protein
VPYSLYIGNPARQGTESSKNLRPSDGEELLASSFFFFFFINLKPLKK